MHSRNTLLDDEEKARLKVTGAGEPRVIKVQPLFLSLDARPSGEVLGRYSEPTFFLGCQAWYFCSLLSLRLPIQQQEG